MVRKDGAEARKERLQEIARFIQQALFKQKELALSTTITQVQYNFGLTEGKTLEYLRLLEKLGQFTLNEKEDRVRKTTEN